MIKTDYYAVRRDGTKLYRTYSDVGMMMLKDGTDRIYSEAIDVEQGGYTYTETDTPIEVPERAITVEDTLEMLNRFGVITDDNY